ncbi:MAG: hypothetical protein KAX05_03680 [Bacteroidales bacterium]|nr:hypothetical protein [Bacteroidales bacterium]
MDKREFIRSLSLGTLGMISGVTLLKSCKSTDGKPVTTLWVWISGRDGFSKNWEDKFRELADHGVYGILLLEDPPSYQSWFQFRYDSVTNLVNQLSVITKERGKKLTAAVFPSPSIAKKLVRQEWTKWNLDAVFPMMYHNYYEEDVK